MQMFLDGIIKMRAAKFLIVSMASFYLLFGQPVVPPIDAAGTPAVTAPASIDSSSPATNTDITGVAVSGLTAGSTYSVSISISNSPTSAGIKLTTVTGLTAAYGYSIIANTVYTSTSFYGSEANINAALATLKYYSGSGGSRPSISITVSEYSSGYAYNPDNGHYYLARTGGSFSGVTWGQANTAASGATFLGQTGYLVTITSTSEQNFVSSKISGARNVWIGAADSASEGTWKVASTGSPEDGKRFWSGTSSGSRVTADGINYANWCSGEPNDSDSSRGGEDHAVTNWNGGTCWNDLNAANTGQIGGYVIEFGTNETGGGFAASATSTIRVNTAPKISYTPSSASTSAFVAYSDLTPTNTGDTATAYSISPALPSGVTMDTNTGTISGAPTTTFSSTSYTVTATNSLGSSTATVSLTSTASKIRYIPSEIIAQTGKAIAPIQATNTNTGTNLIASNPYQISPALPTGMYFNRANGQISGTPTTAQGSTVYTITASYVNSTVQKTQVTITVNPIAPEISLSAGPDSATVTVLIGKDVNLTLTPLNIGGPATSWSRTTVSITGSGVAEDVSFDPNTGIETATAANLDLGQYVFEVTASNATGSDTMTVTINVEAVTPAPVLVSPGNQSFVYGETITPVAFINTGGLATTWSISGSLPEGLNFDTSTGLITGAPLAPSASTSYTITATNNGGSNSVTITLSVAGISKVTFDNISKLYDGSTLTILPVATPADGQTFTYAVTQGDCTISGGVLSKGSAAVGSVCKVTATASATATYSSGVETQTVTVYPSTDLILTQPSSLTIVEGNNAVFNVAKQGSLSGTTTYQWYFAGEIISGAVSETLTVATTQLSDAGDYYVILTYTEAGLSTTQTSNTATLTINLPSPPNISISPSSISGVAGRAITEITPTNSGGASSQWSIAPALPSGLSLDPATGKISGTPTVSSPETTYTVTALNGGTQASSDTISIKIDPAPADATPNAPVSWITGNLSSITLGSVVSIKLNASNASLYELKSGVLPPGLNLEPTSIWNSPTTGILSGIPTKAGTYTFTVAASSRSNSGQTRQFTLEVLPPLPVLWDTAPLSPTITGTSLQLGLSARGATTYSLLSGQLPIGLVLNSNSGIITGIPTKAGIYVFQILASNPYNTGQAQQFTWIVNDGNSSTNQPGNAAAGSGTENAGGSSSGNTGTGTGTNTGTGGTSGSGVGSGSEGNSSTNLPDLIPVKLESNFTSGNIVLLDGKSITATLKPNEAKNGLNLIGGDFALTLTAVDSNGKPIPLSSNNSLIVQQNQFVRTQGTGFLPNSIIKIFIFSNPTLVGTLNTDGKGSFNGVLPVPATISIGEHVLQILGYSADKKVRVASIPLLVIKAPVTPVVKPQSAGVITFTKGSFVISNQAKQVIKGLDLKKVKAVTIYGFASNSRISDDLRISLDRAIEVRKQLQKLYPKLQISVLGQGIRKVAACKPYNNLCAVVVVKK